MQQCKCCISVILFVKFRRLASIACISFAMDSTAGANQLVL